MKFKHDCDKCIFLGTYIGKKDGHKGEEYDLYYCDTEPTVIARYGDEGYQYMSGMVFAHPDGNEPLYEAKKRAIEKGLIKK